MIKYKYHLREPGFSDIINGNKKIEGRLNKNTFSKIKSNDQILFTNNELVNPRSVIVNVIKVMNYDSFTTMINAEELDLIRPNAKSIDDALQIYRKYYSFDNEKKYGVLAIYITLC
jgi:ASC-1-like (ASCH) protein